VRCLLKAGRKCVVWNRDRVKAELILREYPDLVEVAESAGDVIAKCETTFCMLSTLEASDAVFPEVEAAVTLEGKTIVDCATLTPERMIAMEKVVLEKGGTFMEAPVSGSKVPAELGQLIFLCGGSDKAVFDKVKPELDLMGKASFFFGVCGAGSKVKLIINMIMAAQLAALGEGFALAEAAGLPLEGDNGLLKVLEINVVNSPMIKLKGPKMIQGDYTPNFPLKHMQKDTRFALQLGDDLAVNLPVAAATNAQFIKAKQSHADDDFAAIYETQKKQKYD